MNLKYDKVFSVIDIEDAVYKKWHSVTPFYRNVDREGIVAVYSCESSSPTSECAANDFYSFEKKMASILATPAFLSTDSEKAASRFPIPCTQNSDSLSLTHSNNSFLLGSDFPSPPSSCFGLGAWTYSKCGFMLFGNYLQSKVVVFRLPSYMESNTALHLNSAIVPCPILPTRISNPEKAGKNSIRNNEPFF